jgi:hypothetical protein
MKTILRLFLPGIFIIFLLSSCWEFLSVDQPDLANPNSSFDVPITIGLTEVDEGGRGYFGILLPVGWTAEDTISYNGVHSGSFIYSSWASASMDSFRSARTGYYWWVCKGDSIDLLRGGTISLTPRIHTDNQTGTFFIDYMITDRFEESGDICYPPSEYVVRSGFYPISVNAPMTAIVSNTNDNGPGSLRQAITNVSNRGEILFNLSYPANVELDSQLVIDRNVTITGPESAVLTIFGTDSTGVFYINEHLKSVNIHNLKISHGNDGYGGGIYCLGSSLSLNNVIISNNSALWLGGGIFFYPYSIWGGA